MTEVLNTYAKTADCVQGSGPNAFCRETFRTRDASNDNPLTYWQQVQSALTHPDA